MKDEAIRDLALGLLRADTEEDVISLLKDAGFWQDARMWRLYGDKEGNFSQAGNQQSLPEAALVEKIINSVDSRLMRECSIRGIDPESEQAPRSVRDAVAMFFEERRSTDGEAGALVNWSKVQRTEESRAITIAATGGRPTRGRRTKRMCLTIADQGEGQSAKRIPRTILSLNAKNKQRIPFVQGKFNMGGTGALRFCAGGLQLVISRRDPKLAATERDNDPTVHKWAITVVRREQPSNKSGDPIHSEFTYLAPVGAEQNPRRGEVLCFSSDTLPIMPKHDEPYGTERSWGTAIKLYEYETSVGQSNVLMKDGLLFSLERLMPEVALPIRLHECRGYEGEKERSFETPIAGLVVRLEDGRGDNLEEGFPKSVRIHAIGMNLTGRIYAFKEDSASTYLKDEGVIFMINGQAHGYLPKSIYTRPKSVGLSRLKDSVLVLIDCSSLHVIQREDLFMSSRDRLSKKPIRYELEREIEQMLHEHPDLKALQARRREQDVASKLNEEKPLEEVLRKVIQASPTLKNIFQLGTRLSQPFAPADGLKHGEDPSTTKGKTPFMGRRHPTYFRFAAVAYGTVYKRNCEKGRRMRIKFETDVENEYFDRAADRGHFQLAVLETARAVELPSYSLTLEDGDAQLNLAFPEGMEIGERIVLRATVTDSTLNEPFVNDLELTVIPQQERTSGTSTRGRKKHGKGDLPAPKGIALPDIISVKTDDQHWVKYKFTPTTACHVISDPVQVNDKTELVHTFYINVDNRSLLTEAKYSKQNAQILQAKFKYGNVLIGLAMLHAEENGEDEGDENRPDKEGEGQEGPSIEDRIRFVSEALSPILLPMIDQLSGLNEAELELLSVTGEDA